MQYRPHRYRTEYPITLITPAGPVKAVIDDVNETGALVTIRGPVARGHKVSMSFLNNRVEAVVHWALRGKCGIAFRPHLTAAQVDALRYKQGGHRSLRHTSVNYAEMR
ncbi:MAG: PilZ domain-containing protein [Yoonia sp.]|nr:PilZ domain-containing protein [Yoonia sp.]